MFTKVLKGAKILIASFLFIFNFFMKDCSILFFADNGGTRFNYQIQGKLNKVGSLNKISFSIDNESNLAYVFSVLDSKVMLTTKGDFCYSFCLEKGKTFNFLIEIQNKQINASVNCKDLLIKILDNEILVSAKYTLNFGGNNSQNKIELKVSL